MFQGKLVVLSVLTCLFIACAPSEQSNDENVGETAQEISSNFGEAFVYVGTYTRGESEGIYIYRMNLDTGDLTPEGAQSGISNPSFLAIHPNHRNLYAVAEVEQFAKLDSGAVAAFSIDPKTGLLTQLDQQLRFFS